MKRKYLDELYDTFKALKNARSVDFVNGKDNINHLINITVLRTEQKINDLISSLIIWINRIIKNKKNNLPNENIHLVLQNYIELTDAKIDFVEIMASDPNLLEKRQLELDKLNCIIKRSRKQILSSLTKKQREYYKAKFSY